MSLQLAKGATSSPPLPQPPQTTSRTPTTPPRSVSMTCLRSGSPQPRPVCLCSSVGVSSCPVAWRAPLLCSFPGPCPLLLGRASVGRGFWRGPPPSGLIDSRRGESTCALRSLRQAVWRCCPRPHLPQGFQDPQLVPAVTRAARAWCGFAAASWDFFSCVEMTSSVPTLGTLQRS